MPFKKGQSGNPGGRNVQKPWRDAVNMALKRGGNHIHEIADKLVRMALDGDMCAIREIAERLDGKPVQITHIETSVEMPDDPQELILARLQEIAEKLGLSVTVRAAADEDG